MTTQVVESQDALRSAFDRLQQDSLDVNGLGVLRARGFARFSEVGFPTTRLESWRFTNVGAAMQRRFVVPVPTEPEPSAIAPFELAGVEGPQIVCIDGRYSPRLSTVGGLPAGVELRSLADVLASDPQIVDRELGQLARFDDPAASFTALNTGFLQDGLVVRIPDHTILETPIRLLFVSTGGNDAMHHPRTLIVVGANSQVRLVESYASLSDGACLTNAVTEVFVGDNAVVDHYKLLRESVEAFHVASMHLWLKRSATFSSNSITLGGAIVRNEVMAELQGEGVECTLNGLYLVNGTRLVDNHTTIHHAKPHCNSHEIYKGILDGQARAVFNGKIVVAIDAQKTDAKQTNKALLLTEEAQINTKPELEIFADDVKCTHGATIGQLDADALFYLRSRGLDRAQARDVLIHAFASDLVNRIKISPIREQLDEVLLQQLPGSGHTSFANV
jgi:Fe-S cluster assembly protein SufD